MDKDEAKLQSALRLICLVKTLHTHEGWRDDTWHFLMTALDERVEGLKEVDAIIVFEYRFIVRVAVAYLKDNPDELKKNELTKRVVEETLQAVNYLPAMPFKLEEHHKILCDISGCREELCLL